MRKSLITTTIPINTAISDPITLNGNVIHAIQWPSTFTGSSSTSITLSGSVDNGVTYKDVYSTDGTELLFNATQDTIQIMDPTIFTGFTHLKFRTGTSSSPTTQTAAKTITIQVEPILA